MFTARINLRPRTRGWSKLALTVVVAVCLTPAPTTAQPSPSDETVSVAGQVFDEQGRAVAGIEIEAFVHKQRPTVRSDATGSFVVQIPKGHGGSLTLRARTNDATLQGFYQFDRIDESRPIAKLVLRPARTLEITVVDGQQRPVEGATVAAMAYWFDKMDETLSDQSGHAVLRVPADAGLQYVWAAKPDAGLDYVVFRRFDEPASNVYKLPPDHKKPLTLVLDGARSVTVRVVNVQSKPVPRATVYPWYFERPNKGDHLNVSGIDEFHATTDADGQVVFRFIPADVVGAITFWTDLEGYHTPERPVFDPRGASSEIIARLVSLVPVHGKVTFADGRPAGDAMVVASGDGYQFDRFREATRTTADGSFTIRVYPNQYYLFSADRDRLVAPAVAKIVRHRPPVDELDLVLQRATRIYGRLTAGEDHQPLAERYLTLYQNYAQQYQALPPEEKLPNPTKSNKAVGPLLGRNTQTDVNGAFEFFAPPGKYYIFGPDTVKVPNFEIADQAELEVNLHADRLDRVVLFGAVVLESDPNRGVPEARVHGWPLDGRGAFVRAVSDADGAFEVERTPSPMMFHAVSKDGTLLGVVRVGADERACEIPMNAAGSARGKLIDAAGGGPLAEEQIEFRFQIPEARGMSIVALQKIVKTNADGEFEVQGLAPGWEYTLEVVTERDPKGDPRRWQTAGAVTPKRGEVVDVGDIKFASSDALGAVTGNIVVDGVPLASGKVIFHPQKHDAVEAEVKDGAFSAKIPVGEMAVTFDFERVPTRFQSAATTPLRASITRGKNNLAFELNTD